MKYNRAEILNYINNITTTTTTTTPHVVSSLIDGCYSSKFLRSSARRFLLEILVLRHEVRSSARRTSSLTMVKLTYCCVGAFRFDFDVAHCHYCRLAITVYDDFSRNIFAVVPTAKVSARKMIELVPRW